MVSGDAAREPSSQGPTVYGYVRVETVDHSAITVLRQEVRRFCQAEGLRLMTVCCDPSCDGSSTVRPGLVAVLDALALPETFALVVPDLDHLSRDDVIRKDLVRSVRRTGAKVLTIRQKICDEGTDDISHVTGGRRNGSDANKAPPP